MTHASFTARLSEPLTHTLTELLSMSSLPRAQARVARGVRRVGDRRQETGSKDSCGSQESNVQVVAREAATILTFESQR